MLISIDSPLQIVILDIFFNFFINAAPTIILDMLSFALIGCPGHRIIHQTPIGIQGNPIRRSSLVDDVQWLVWGMPHNQQLLHAKKMANLPAQSLLHAEAEAEAKIAPMLALVVRLFETLLGSGGPSPRIHWAFVLWTTPHPQCQWLPRPPSPALPGTQRPPPSRPRTPATPT